MKQIERGGWPMRLAFAFLVFAGVGIPQLVAQPIISDFSAGVDGWAIQGNISSFVPDWNPAGGNPGGYISDVDVGPGRWDFVAPGKFLGNQSSKYGEMFCFDRFQDRAITTPTTASLILSGPGGTLQHDTIPPPPVGVSNWGTQCVQLDETAAWAGSPSQLTVQNVLANLTTISIRGDFHGEPAPDLETTGLDNVIMFPVELQAFAIE